MLRALPQTVRHAFRSKRRRALALKNLGPKTEPVRCRSTMSQPLADVGLLLLRSIKMPLVKHGDAAFMPYLS